MTFYVIVNFIIFGDVGLVPSGRIVFASLYGYFDYLLLPLAIAGAMYIIRLKHGNASGFRYLFRFGIATTLTSAVLFSAFIFVALESDPEYFEKLIHSIRSIEIPSSGPTAFQEHMLQSAVKIEQTSLLRSSLFYAVANLVVYSALGLISSYLSAKILSAERQTAPRTKSQV